MSFLVGRLTQFRKNSGMLLHKTVTW